MATNDNGAALVPMPSDLTAYGANPVLCGDPPAVPAASKAVVAPYPLVDKYPTVVGSNLSLTYLASVFRLCLTGYRREYVDALNELLERDPHLFAVLSQRVLTVVGGRIEVTPCDDKSLRGRKIAEEVERQVKNIPDLQQALAALVMSGLYYGVGCSEIGWRYTGARLEVSRLFFIHSRRLNYPDPNSWDMRIWDQGQVGSYETATARTSAMFGIRVVDFPGKFLPFTPQLRAEYPTREGLGRQVAIWSALKSMGARGAAQFVERFAKPWAIATYSTQKDGNPRAANTEDITAGDAALRALGTGSLAGATIPDSIKVTIDQVSVKGNITHREWIDLCNKEISKAILGQTDTTDGGPGGSRAKAETQKEGSNQLARFDAACVTQMLQGLVDIIVKNNFPGDWDKRPKIAIYVDAEPDPAAIMDTAAKGAAMGLPVDADALADDIGIKLVDPTDPKARQLVPLALSPIEQVFPDRFEAIVPPAPPPGAPGADGKSGNAKGGPAQKQPAKQSSTSKPAQKPQAR